jgi:UDP-GlcNAc:undecaprenyl-phosphate GlcNAc-1-phosphate transferase
MAPDRLHLHHRMLALGHSHRRAVLILYVWTMVFAFGTAALVEWNWRIVMACTAVAVLVAIVVTMGPLRHRGRFLDDDAALERAAQVRSPEPVSGAVPQTPVAARPAVTARSGPAGPAVRSAEGDAGATGATTRSGDGKNA